MLNLMIKGRYAGSAETPSMIANLLKLPHRVVQLLLEQAQERKLLDVLGAANGGVGELRYVPAEKGRRWAMDALAQNQYVGPAPVSLAAYTDPIQRQRITNERVDRPGIGRAFANMVISEPFVHNVGPA